MAARSGGVEGVRLISDEEKETPSNVGSLCNRSVVSRLYPSVGVGGCPTSSVRPVTVAYERAR
jgi:hypothetical protein